MAMTMKTKAATNRIIQTTPKLMAWPAKSGICAETIEENIKQKIEIDVSTFLISIYLISIFNFKLLN
jgi:hypothetical protein